MFLPVKVGKHKVLWEQKKKTVRKSAAADVDTFYMYRAMNGDKYPMENVNTASLAGVMWYLHNEVVCSTPRKYGISRVVRLKVQVATPHRLKDKGMKFGARFAYDGETCTGAGPWVGPDACRDQWMRYGYFVGCNVLGHYPFPMASQGFPVHYPGAVWYSLPRKGHCKGSGPVTGEEHCVYKYENAGEVTIDEIANITDYWSNANNRPGWKEYDLMKDRGTDKPSFWDKKFDTAACKRRLERAEEVFRKKYPDDPSEEDLPTPKCDFDCLKFYPHPPAECKVKQPNPGCQTPDECAKVQKEYNSKGANYR